MKFHSIQSTLPTNGGPFWSLVRRSCGKRTFTTLKLVTVLSTIDTSTESGRRREVEKSIEPALLRLRPAKGRRSMRAIWRNRAIRTALVVSASATVVLATATACGDSDSGGSASARPEGSASKLSTFRDGWRILKTHRDALPDRATGPVFRKHRRGPRPRGPGPVDSADPDVSRHGAGATLPDSHPGDRNDDRRDTVLLRRPDPRHGHARAMLHRWLAVSAALFAASALLYAVRLAGRRR